MHKARRSTFVLYSTKVIKYSFGGWHRVSEKGKVPWEIFSQFKSIEESNFSLCNALKVAVQLFMTLHLLLAPENFESSSFLFDNSWPNFLRIQFIFSVFFSVRLRHAISFFMSFSQYLDHVLFPAHGCSSALPASCTVKNFEKGHLVWQLLTQIV